jgi:hypothetical protein
MKFHKKNEIKISINCAVRRNCPWISGLVDSFLENTVYPDSVELILGIDHRDTTTRFFAPNVKTLVLDQRCHKADLWIYNNLMYEISRGKLLAEVADDFFIMTPGWDRILFPYCDEAEKKIFRIVTQPYEGGDFHPFYSRKYYEVLGHMGIHDITSYNNTVFEKLPSERTLRVDNVLLRDRRVTGNLSHDTKFVLPDGRIVDGLYGTEPNPDGSTDFGSEEGCIPNNWGWGPETHAEISKDVSKLLKAIAEGA